MVDDVMPDQAPGADDEAAGVEADESAVEQREGVVAAGEHGERLDKIVVSMVP